MADYRADAEDAAFTVVPVNGGVDNPDNFVIQASVDIQYVSAISISYGTSERDLLPEYSSALCKQFVQLGVRGVSILGPSGDSGVDSGDCGDVSGNNDFIFEFSSTCMCGILSRLISTRQGQVQIINQTTIGPFVQRWRHDI